MMTMISGGAQASKSGKGFENYVESTLKNNGYRYVKKPVLDTTEGKWYAKQFPLGKTIYGTTRKCDFVIHNEAQHKDCLVIECKWQDSKGSVDEKYPYLVQNILESKRKTIIVLDGGGYKPAAYEWLKKQCGGVLLHVWEMKEFQQAMQRGFF